MSLRHKRPPTEHEIWKPRQLAGRPYVEGTFHVGEREVTARVMPDMEPAAGYLWGLTAPGYRPSRPQPAADDPKRRYWKPPLRPIALGGRCPDISAGKRQCEQAVDEMQVAAMETSAAR